MNPRVTKVIPTKNYELILTFTNNETRSFDVKPYLNIGLFETLKNHSIFASAKCCMGSIQWQNGLDLCPDTLYEESIIITNSTINE